MTEKLYDKDSKLMNFEASVTVCEKTGRGYFIVLDRTAFFPESGGQYGDTGKIGDAIVSDTRYDGDKIIHITDRPIEVGSTVFCALDREMRLRKMQNHTGEHIVSSIMHRRFGYDNVGFHLGNGEMTFDISGTVSAEQMTEIEKEANLICAENVAVKAYYPDKESLAAMEYRSKGDIDGKVRIVEIDGVDKCACCAPHVSMTGEIGMIKILGFIRYKGGIRIRMKCGLDALDDFDARLEREVKISELLCVPQEEIADGVVMQANALSEKKREAGELKRHLTSKLAGSVGDTDGNVCIFADYFGTDELRGLANLCSDKCRIFTALSDCGDGYLFVCASHRVPLKVLAKIISEKGHGRCGGSDLMLTGKLCAGRTEIEELFGRL